MRFCEKENKNELCFSISVFSGWDNLIEIKIIFISSGDQRRRRLNVDLKYSDCNLMHYASERKRVTVMTTLHTKKYTDCL